MGGAEMSVSAWKRETKRQRQIQRETKTETVCVF